MAIEFPPWDPYDPPVAVNCDDNCPAVVNPFQDDSDMDGEGALCDADDDNDGVPDSADNCPQIVNVDQSDYDGDTVGGFCDADADDDGLLNTLETYSSWLDADSDDDNYTDFEEIWHNGEAGYQIIFNRDTSPADADKDNDGLLVHSIAHYQHGDLGTGAVPDGDLNAADAMLLMQLVQ